MNNEASNRYISDFLWIGFVVLAFCTIYPTHTQGQENSQFRFTTIINNGSGLPNNEVTDIVKDNQGFLWIATSDGLCRYESTTQQIIFTVDKDAFPEGLHSNTIRTLYTDRQDHLWIGTTLGGLTRYHHPTNTWKTFVHDPEDSSSISNNEILSIIEDSSGKIWVGTEYGLNLFDPVTESFFSFLPELKGKLTLKSKAIVDIMEDRRGYIWLSTWAGGMYLLLPGETGRPEDIKFRNLKIETSTSSENVWVMYEDKKGRFWVGSHGGGLYLMDVPVNYSNKISKQDWTPDFYGFVHDPNDTKSLTNDGVQAITQDDNGNLWVGTINGLNVLMAKDIPTLTECKAGKNLTGFKRFRDNSSIINALPSDNISSIYPDNQGIIWLATAGGVCQFNNSNNQFHSINREKLGSIDPDYGRMYVDTNNFLWIANSEKGLLKYNLSEHKAEKIYQKTLINHHVMAIYGGDSKELTVATAGGITLLDMESNATEHFPFPEHMKAAFTRFYVSNLWNDQHGLVWIATLTGLYILDTKDGSYTGYRHIQNDPVSLVDNSITSVFQDSRENIWVTTYNGMSQVIGNDHRNLKFKNYKADTEHPEKGPVSNRIISINEIGNILYIGTFSGLCGYDLNEKVFKDLSKDQPKFRVNSITDAGDGTIWLSSTDGLIRYDYNTGGFTRFLKEDGLYDVYFSIGSSCMDQNGNLYFGNQNGITWFHPGKILKNETPPPVYVTEVKSMSTDELKNINTIFKNKITVNHDVYYLSFSFAGLNYNKSEKNKYAYRLKGFEENWIYTDHTTPVVYTNLIPGEYTFQVKSANNDGVWNESGATLKVEVLHAFWETWWFKTGSILLLCIITWGGFNLYTSSVRNRNLQLKQYNDNLNKEIFERKKVEQALHEREQHMEHLVDKRTEELHIKSELLLEKNKEIEELLTQIKTRNEELEVIVAKRTQNLKEANLELTRSNRDLEQFAYMASHDLQEPIRTVSNFLGLLKMKYRELLPDSARQYIDFADDGAKRMSKLISSLLTYSQVGQKGMEFKQTELKEMLEYKLLDLGQRIEERNAVVTLEHLPVLFCEPNQLAMVFYNLINNAIKFNQSNQPTVEVFEYHDGPEGYWTIAVRDNGIGIPEADQQRIFEVFSRLHSRGSYEGTGIGLALCKKVVHSHGGNVWLESTPDEGTTFYVSIDKNLSDRLRQKKASFDEAATGASWKQVISN